MAYIGKKPEDLIRGNATYNAFTGDGSTTTFDVTNLLPDGGSFDVEVFGMLNSIISAILYLLF